MSKSKGYVKIYRDILNHWVYDDEILFRAWINLLLTANHSEKKVMFDGELITIHTGETLTSLRQLSEKWKCGLKKTRSIINILEKEQMITRKSVKKGTQKGTLISIVNYGVYQDLGHTKETAEGTTEGTTEGTQTINNKECVNNVKERERVKNAPTLADIKEYCLKNNKGAPELSMQKFYTWLLTENGKRYISHWPERLEIWIAEDKEREKMQPKTNKALDYSQREYSDRFIEIVEKKKLGITLTEEEEAIYIKGHQRAQYGSDWTDHVFES